MERKEVKYAGVLVKSKDTNRYFLMLRNAYAKEPLTWGLISGGIEENEAIIDGLKREVMEECGIDPNIIKYDYIREELYGKHSFYYYQGLTESEFIPKLDHENLEWGWFSYDELPEPLFPRLIDKINGYE